jgi:rRNA maturation protein Nop10
MSMTRDSEGVTAYTTEQTKCPECGRALDRLIAPGAAHDHERN